MTFQRLFVTVKDPACRFQGPFVKINKEN